MFERWFYSRDGKTHGPMTIAEAVRRAAAGELRASDKLWPADFDPQMAFPASSTIDFRGLGQTAPAAPPPPPAAKKPPPPPAAGVPDWLSDVAEVEKKPSRPRDPAPLPPVPASVGLPDWLSDVEVTDRFIVRGPPPRLTGVMVTPPAPPPPGVVAPPVPKAPAPPAAIPARPMAPLAPAAPARPTPSAPVVPVAQPRVVPPSAPPPSAVPPTAPPVPTPSAAPADTPAETGFDPETGQVLDADKYRRWQKRQKEIKTEAPAAGETVYEVFLRANRTLQDWIDQEMNRPLLTKGLAAVRADAGIQALIASFGMWGQDFTNKLWQRLEFLVTNRLDFYASRG
jgi:hypothetical protein